MKYLLTALNSLLIGPALGFALGGSAKALNELGIVYYWHAVFLAAIVSVVMLRAAFKNGYTWQSNHRFLVSIVQIVASIISVPTAILVFKHVIVSNPFWVDNLPVGAPIFAFIMFVSGAAELIDWSSKNDQNAHTKNGVTP